MEEKQPDHARDDALVETRAPRKAYVRPELVTFGSVRDLTRTGTKGGSDVGTRRK